MRGILGFIIMIQGVMGFIGQVFFGHAWGLLPRWFDLPSAAYVGLVAAGAALAVWGDADKKRKAKQIPPEPADKRCS